MSLKDDVLALFDKKADDDKNKDKAKTFSQEEVDALLKKAKDDKTDGDKSKGDDDDKPKMFTQDEVKKLVDDVKAETKEAMAELVNKFKGDGTPQTGTDASETNHDFQSWNKKVSDINKQNNGSK